MTFHDIDDFSAVWFYSKKCHTPTKSIKNSNSTKIVLKKKGKIR